MSYNIPHQNHCESQLQQKELLFTRVQPSNLYNKNTICKWPTASLIPATHCMKALRGTCKQLQGGPWRRWHSGEWEDPSWGGQVRRGGGGGWRCSGSRLNPPPDPPSQGSGRPSAGRASVGWGIGLQDIK